MKYGINSFVSLAATFLSGSLPAHHGDAGRYEEEVSTVTGVVVAVQLINPHSAIIMDVEDENGNVVRWRTEMGSPAQLATNFGWNRATLAAGTKVQVTGRVAKSGAPYINLSERARIVLVEACEEIYHSRTLPENPPSCT